VWKVKPTNTWHICNVSRTQVVIGQSFGMGPNGTPGESNIALAEIAKDLNWRHCLKLILQHEINDGLYVKKLIKDSTSKHFKVLNIIVRHSVPGKYLDTYEVIRQSAVICKENGWKTVAVLAHPDHAWRVMMTAKKLGIYPYLVDTKYFHDMVIPYDPKSLQVWTRNKFFFIAREIPTRLYYLYKGWI
jgi:hypothetical protein